MYAPARQATTAEARRTAIVSPRFDGDRISTVRTGEGSAAGEAGAGVGSTSKEVLGVILSEGSAATVITTRLGERTDESTQRGTARVVTQTLRVLEYTHTYQCP